RSMTYCHGPMQRCQTPRPWPDNTAYFQFAVVNGVRAHHWRFGDMPPQQGLSEADVSEITAYVRELQRENGIE
ncbi:c-type cytochrome, partial [Agrobacterium tumefaciens]|uniref:c-type cytochrome n=1 Tax=Agrobacterium tumefaciens TaxID=358 RepID=UPI0035B524D6